MVFPRSWRTIVKWHSSRRRQGSILIIVLWILLLISLLAGRYLSHNRGKAAAAAYGWKSLLREQAFLSVLELYATSGQPLPQDGNIEEVQPAEGNVDNEQASETVPLLWRLLTIGGLNLLVRESSEGKRIDLNSAADDAIRKQLRQGLGEDSGEEADQVADALLDWRDPDDLVRSDGAEKDFYQQEGLSYEPANGPFKTLTEMLLVRGVTPELFWGTTPQAGSMDLENVEEEEEEKTTPFSLINAFTISAKNVKRVEVVFPQDDGNAVAFIALLQAKGQKWSLFRCYRCYLPAAEKEKKTGEEG
jgi:hypothetical protein